MNVTFVMEQHIGHRSYYENLRRFLDRSTAVNARWVEVTYDDAGYWWNRLPGLPRSLRGTLNGRAQVRQGLSRYPGEIALFNTQTPAALGGGLTRRRPYVLCTDITPVQYDEMGEHYGHRRDRLPALRAYKHRANLRLFREAARILPWSNWTRRSLLEDYGVDARRIEVVPPGVDLTFWEPGNRSDHNDPLRILFVGGDFYRKGGELLLTAFNALPAGSAELLLVTRSRVEHAPGVKVFHDMKPNTPELRALYQSSDVFVFPTRAEAFGIAAVEAAAAGLPVIATAVGGLSDIVVDGETGFLVEPDDLDALVRRLKMLAESPALRIRQGGEARLRAERYFDARRNAGRIVEVLGEATCGER